MEFALAPPPPSGEFSSSRPCCSLTVSFLQVQVEDAIDPSKVRVHGPGVEPGVRSLQPTHFVVDAKNAGPGEVEVALSDALTGGAVDLDVLDNHDGSFTIRVRVTKFLLGAV